ncbi:MAG: molybdenum cofactor biosynthesis protein MoaB [Deltaproteobacteria bacterium]|jgi:molybdenum cofactor biosynthesis protein B|nr:molybdenum cofactor biosynthesis protein MoaB [Deltaproteobacteria bacterium]MCL6120328.1 molybdenum cofactor biosynthesis protein MoaB [Deltaproteobacteria bacterium]
MGHIEHKKNINAKKRLSVYVITLSDTRKESEDESGNYIKKTLASAGHEVSGYALIKDDEDLLESLIVKVCGEEYKPKTDAVIINGGTGVSFKDITYETLKNLYDKELYGFGEIFRSLSYNEIGTAAIMSRASAGIYNGKIIFSVPGSINAVTLAMNNIILKEIGHLYYEISKHLS